jgi:ribosomal protein S18 acetylase RimI-like enzyme
MSEREPHILQFRYGSLASEDQSMFAPDRVPTLLHGLVTVLEESAYAPSETLVAEFLARVVGGDSPSQAHEGFFVALVDERTVGFLQARCVFDDAEIDYVAVARAHRGKGIAGALLGAFETASLALGASRLLLEVGERNVIARALYKGQGYEPVGRRENYYKGGEAAIVYEKTP